jgi:23S rRNA pseudouridine1911/1915/1917 synthase
MSDPDSEAAPALKELTAGDDAAGQRLDQWLAAQFAPDLSRSRVQALIREGEVAVDGVPERSPGRRLAGGERIGLALPAPGPAAPLGEDIPLAVLYEDDELLVIDKPAGLVVHPGAGNPSGTLVNALIHHCGTALSGVGGADRPGIVHRLDRDTSGVLVVARTDRAHRALAAAFADHGHEGDLERAYDALVWGAPARAAGTIDAALGRSASDRTRRLPDQGEYPARAARRAGARLPASGAACAPSRLPPSRHRRADALRGSAPGRFRGTCRGVPAFGAIDRVRRQHSFLRDTAFAA